MDTFGLDSEYQYDPVWTKCEELGIAPDFHSVGYGWGSRTSIFNYVHNHIGNFATSARSGLPRPIPGAAWRSRFPACASCSWKVA